MPSQPTSRRRLLADLALAVAVAAVALAWTAAGWWHGAGRAPDPPGYALVAGACLALAVRRRWPFGTLAVVAVLTSAYLVLGYPYGLIQVAFLLAVGTVARELRPAVSAPAAAGALLVLLAHLATNPAALPWPYGLVPASAWAAVPYAVGLAVRLAAEASRRARAEAIRHGVEEELLRVAQEVHDAAGHGLSAIKMQADVALHLLERRPEQARTALDAISRTSGSALDELRTTLGVIGPATRVPAGLAGIGELTDRMADAGVDVTLETAGRPAAPLPVAVDVAGYRIVQESLTNVLRYGRQRRARVRVAYTADAVTVAVVSPYGGPDGSGFGGVVGGVGGGGRPGPRLGLAGMRRRTEELGGTFRAGPTAAGTFEVHATIPAGRSE